MNPTFQRDNVIISALKVSILFSALDAISLGPLPLTWVAIWIPIAVSIITRTNFGKVPIYFYLLILWAGFVQIFSLFCLNEESCAKIEMPPLSTTPYPIYITLRILPFLMFASVLSMMATLKGKSNEVYSFILRAGGWVASIALYVYFAQRYGLPDIPRSRLGTDGAEVTSVTFSYSFHRALGTFREPSGMAVWLILPFFLSLVYVNWRTYVIGAAILLSGSMSAYVAIIGGGTLALILLILASPPARATLTKLPLRLGVVLLFSGIIFSIFVNKGGDYQGLMAIIQERLLPVVTEGVGESNRGYVFEFVTDVGIPIVGYGLGNINLMLTSWLGGDAVAGILSLYLNILMSLGIIGLIMLIGFLFQPLLKKKPITNPLVLYSVHAAYISWLIVFTIHSAEFPLMFAVTYGLIISLKYLK